LVSLLGMGALLAIPLAFGLSLAGLLKNSHRAYGLAGTIISGATAVLVIGFLAVGLVVTMCS
jgi:hypothetical protein